MKDFVLMISFVFSSLFLQETTSSVIDFKIPTNAKKITFAQYKAEKKKFNGKRVPLDFKNLYQVGGILMGVELGKYPLSYPITLERLKEAGPELMRKNETMISNEIVRINNVRILVRKCHTGNEYNYHFYSDFKQDSNLSGIMEFKVKDRQQAELLFNQLLKSIRWK